MKIGTFLLLLLTFFQVSSQQSKLLDTAEGKVLLFAEQMPEFPGGDDALASFLHKNIKYPIIALENEVQGQVMAEFIICEDGSLCQLKIIKSPDTTLNPAVMNVLSKMPNWIPAKQNGKEVKVYFSVPINFIIEDDNEKRKELTVNELTKMIEKHKAKRNTFTYRINAKDTVNVNSNEEYQILIDAINELGIKDELQMYNLVDRNLKKSKTTYKYIIKG